MLEESSTFSARTTCDWRPSTLRREALHVEVVRGVAANCRDSVPRLAPRSCAFVFTWLAATLPLIVVCIVLSSASKSSAKL